MHHEWHVVIMAGGRGERLQPLTGPQRPKPLLPVRGGGTLLSWTMQRARRLVPRSRIWIVTTAMCQMHIARAVSPARRSRIITEPGVRGTATCIGVMAQLIAAQARGAAGLIVLPADHWIAPMSRFTSTLRAAIRQAEFAPEALVCVGIPPTGPETGYGYIHHRGNRVTRFTEKPRRAQALAWLRQRRVLWNGGIFVGTVAAFQSALRRCVPSLAEALTRLPEQGPRWRQALTRLYAALPARSFDRAALERYDDVRVVRAQFAWHDVGAWTAWPVLLRLLDVRRL